MQKGNLTRPVTKREGRKTGNSEAKEEKQRFFFFSILFISIHVKHSSGNVMLVMFIYVRLSYL